MKILKKGKLLKEVFALNFRGISILYKNDPAMILSRMLHIVWTSLTPYIPIYLSALIIEEISTGNNPRRLKHLVVLTLGCSVFIGVIDALLARWKNTKNRGLYLYLEHIFWQKLLNMDYVDLDDSKTNELLSSIRQNQNGAGWGMPRLMQNFDSFCSSVLTLVGSMALTISLFATPVPASEGRHALLNSPVFSIAVVGLMLACVCLSAAMATKSETYWARSLDSQNLLNRILSFFALLGYRKEIATDVRTYSQDQLCAKYIANKTLNPFSSQGIFARLSRGPIGLYWATSSAASVGTTGIAYAFVCLKSWAGAFGLGSVTQYVISLTKASEALTSLMTCLGEMENNTPFLKQIFTLLDFPNRMYQGSLTVEKRRDRNYEVEFRNVSFQYPGSESYALRNVSMKFQIGKRLSVVGVNGSGKSTFIKLLCRLYDPTEGEILLNGINIRKYNYSDYMNLFSVVFQDFHLFSLPLGENVAGKSDYDHQLVHRCLQQAGLNEQAPQFSQGINTFLYKNFSKNGVDVSGGEAQKIAIARALYKNAPFIILDEPTAALDPIAEAEIYEKFNHIIQDKTAVYISHRLSSCKFCDEIVVFHEGSVIQQGTHDSLVADKNGKYHELWQAQAQYYTV